MYWLVKQNDIQKTFIEKGLRIFTLAQFRQLLGFNEFKAERELEKFVKEGFLIRLKRGLYTFSSNIISDEEIGNALYRPSYISLEYALSWYSILPETVYTITSVTTKPTRSFSFQDKTFSYSNIKQNAFAGYTPVKRGNQIVLIAEKEKALVDYLHFVAISKKTLNDRLQLSGLDAEKAIEYAALYKSKKLNNLIRALL